MHRYKDCYIGKGYVVMENAPSCINSILMENRLANRVVKLSQDRAYDKFVRYAAQRTDPHFPIIYAHNEHGGEDLIGGEPWCTVTEMERLGELTPTEESLIVPWLHQLSAAISASGGLSNVTADPFELLDVIRGLLVNAWAENVGLDTLKSTNFLARGLGTKRQIVVTDPYN
jgi:hypothetical protein